ncbi:ACT domain-containing protein [Deinococcus hopiensis]
MNSVTSVSSLTLSVLPGEYSVAQLPPSAPLPVWAASGKLWAIVGAPGEISVVTESARIPADVQAENGWAALQLHGPFPFHLTGVLSAVLVPLRGAGVGIFALSTFDTDYVLVKAQRLAEALQALRSAGHTVTER